MSGEFRGDFTRDTFDPRNNFLRVLMQQGRVQIDADWNEQVSILLHYLQTLAEDLIGPYGGPANRSGFQITFDSQKDVKDNKIQKFQISTGNYYVNGILCQNSKIDEQGNEITSISYYEQKDYPLNEDQDELPDVPFLVYLDVWERHITYIENERIREVALGGADTASRSQVVWQVKVTELEAGITKCTDIQWNNLVEKWQSPNRGLLKAKAKEDQQQTDACIISPHARYRGAENQLYRVEIHSHEAGTTFKWSRENGSVVFPLDIDSSNSAATGSTSVSVKLKQWWRDERFGLVVGDWVEIVDDDSILHQWVEPLWKVDKIEPDNFLVTLKRETESRCTVGQNPKKHPQLRRWDQKEKSGVNLVDGAVPIVEVKVNDENWITLEDGVQIQFQKSSSEKHSYRTGDYWLIPVRTATDDVEWPQLNGKPVAMSPHGIVHYYAPLAVIGNVSSSPEDCRRQFKLFDTIDS
jgi:hypothetical protein